MKKKIDFDKVMKAIGILAIVAIALWYFSSKSNNAYKDREAIWSKLSSIAEELNNIAGSAYDAYYSEDYDEMHYCLYSIESRCEKLSSEAEALADKFADKDTDDGSERRSWFY